MIEYDDLLKQLKPLTVKLERLPPEEVAKYKVLDDVDRIFERPVRSPAESVELSSSDDEEVEEVEQKVDEIDIIELSDGGPTTSENQVQTSSEAAKTPGNDKTDEKKLSIMCIFCQVPLFDLEEASVHYRHHVDYYPYKCFVCDEVAVNMDTFRKHVIQKHSSGEGPQKITAKYICKQNLYIENWINNFLASQSTSIYKTFPQLFCPACDWVELNDLSEKNKKVKQRPVKVLSHIHRHLKYTPFECSECRKIGREMLFAYVDFSARQHLLSVHKDLLQKDVSTSLIFPRKHAIPKLDEFIKRYMDACNIQQPRLSPFIKKMTQKEQEKLIEKSLPKNKELTNKSPVVIDNSYYALKKEDRSYTAVSPMQSQVAVTQQSQMIELLKTPITSSSQTSNPGEVEPTGSNYLTYKKINALRPNLLFLKENLDKHFEMLKNENMRMIPDEFYLCNDEPSDLLCIFCDEKKTFPNKTEAQFHYAKHLNYKPIVCLLCQDKFFELSELQTHTKDTHPEVNEHLLYYVDQNENIESWVDEFLDFQGNPEFLSLVSFTTGSCCLVCNKLSPDDDIEVLFKNDDYVKVFDHVKHHLRYFSYVCMICHHESVSSRFCTINDAATNHLRLYHHFTEESVVTYIKDKVFLPLRRVDYLEKFIYDKLKPLLKTKKGRKLQIPQITLSQDIQDKVKLNEVLKRKLEKILPELLDEKRKKMSNNNANQENKSPEIDCITLNDDYFGDGLVETSLAKKLPINKTNSISSVMTCLLCGVERKNSRDLKLHIQEAHPNVTPAFRMSL